MGLRYNLTPTVVSLRVQDMEAEQLNSIANRLVDLKERHQALRGYL